MPARVGQVSVPTPRSQDKGHGAARMAMGTPPTIQLAPFSQSIVAPFAAFKLDTPRSARSSRAPGEGVSPRLSPRASRPSTAASRPGTSSSARSSNRLLEYGQKHLFSPSQQHSRFSGGAGRQVISPFATFRDLMPPPISIAVSSGDAVENDLMPPVHEQPSSPRAGQLRQATYSSEPTGPCLSFFQQLGPLRRPVPSADAANSAGAGGQMPAPGLTHSIVLSQTVKSATAASTANVGDGHEVRPASAIDRDRYRHAGGLYGPLVASPPAPRPISRSAPSSRRATASPRVAGPQGDTTHPQSPRRDAGARVLPASSSTFYQSSSLAESSWADRHRPATAGVIVRTQGGRGGGMSDGTPPRPLTSSGGRYQLAACPPAANGSVPPLNMTPSTLGLNSESAIGGSFSPANAEHVG